MEFRDLMAKVWENLLVNQSVLVDVDLLADCRATVETGG